MSRTLCLALSMSVALFCATPPKHSSSANFATDLQGEPDTRPGTWGHAGSVVWKVHFNTPPGYRVRILRVYGDFVIWPKGKPPEGTYAGALFALHTSTPGTSVSKFSDLMADNCFLYVQLATGGKPERAAFDNSVAAGGLLGKDHTLYVKAAVWLNDTGLPIHMEPTWVSVYQIEDTSGNTVGFRSPTYKRTLQSKQHITDEIAKRAGHVRTRTSGVSIFQVLN